MLGKIDAGQFGRGDERLLRSLGKQRTICQPDRLDRPVCLDCHVGTEYQNASVAGRKVVKSF